MVRSFALELSESQSNVTSELQLSPSEPVALSLDRLMLKMESGKTLFKWIEQLYDESEKRKQPHIQYSGQSASHSYTLYYRRGKAFLEKEYKTQALSQLTEFEKHCKNTQSPTSKSRCRT